MQNTFLNGGLFEPINNYDWGKTDIILPNDLFSNRTKNDIEGSGVLDVFDLYNFTVREDEPLEKEVAIDPEMLGKVFENLLSDNLRKGQGAYYTPREIVHYMCQESLINYQQQNSLLIFISLSLDGRGQGEGDVIDCHPELVSGSNPVVSPEDIRKLIRMGDATLESETVANQKEQDIQTGKIKKQ